MESHAALSLDERIAEASILFPLSKLNHQQLSVRFKQKRIKKKKLHLQEVPRGTIDPVKDEARFLETQSAMRKHMNGGGRVVFVDESSFTYKTI